MKATLFAHLGAIVLAALAVWAMRQEVTAKAAPRRAWATAPVAAVLVAVILLVVSPGKRFELWAAAIVGGVALGAVAGMLLKVNQDFGHKLIRVAPAWDGMAAAAALLLLAVARFVSSDLMTRRSGKFGVLAAAATFLAVYIAVRYLVMRFHKAPNAMHLDMSPGQDPGRTLVH